MPFKEIQFDEEIAFPKKNLVIYQRIYNIELWIRRIVYTSLMAKFGTNWVGVLPNELSKNLKSRLHSLSGRVHLDCENSNNIIWLTNMDELVQILTMKSLWSMVKDFTGYNYKVIKSKLDELREIRNVISHNRAVTTKTLTIFNGLSTSIEHGISNFKKNIMYEGGEISLDASDDNIADTFFHEKSSTVDLGKCQHFLEDKKYFYNVVRLPVPPWDYFFDVEFILRSFQSVDKSLLAIFINSSCEEFQIIWSKNIPKDESDKIIDIFFEIAWSDDILTDSDYDEQSAKFICDPKIWFYLN